MKSRLQLSVSCFVVVLAFALSAATYTSQSYSRSGLIGQWDGIDNAGVRQHDATVTKWKDLAGTIGDFTITTTVAGFTENGLKKTASGVMAKVARPNAAIKTVEVVLSGIPASGWVNAFFMDHPNGGNITITVRNSEKGGATEPRQYFFDKGSHGLSTNEKPENQTLTAIFDSDKLKDNSLFFCNGTRPTGNPYSNTWYSWGSDIQLGGRAVYPTSGDATTWGYTIHAIRIYNRELTEAEIARHAKIDQVRFFGASDADDGMSYVSDGLMGWWDGVDNVGTGQHDPNATAWKDLSGANAGDFLVQSKTASFTANGLKKTAKGFCATNTVVHHGVLMMESVVSGVPASGWVHPIFLSTDQTITFRNEGNGTRLYFFDNDTFKRTAAETSDPVTVAIAYEKTTKAIGTAYYVNGECPPQDAQSTTTGCSWGGSRISSIGGRPGYDDKNDGKIFGYTVHSVRLYNRVLAPAEAAYNAAVDRCRLFGRPVGDGFAYRIADEDAIECQLRAWTYGLGGMVKMESDDSVADYVATEWAPFGAEQTATFTAVPAEDCVFLGWTGDVEAITSGTASDLTVTVSSKKGVALQAVFTLPTTGEYVTDGLIGWWDGKENAGYGHHDLAATTWKDLTGTTGDFTLTDGVASFTADGLKKVAVGVMAKVARPSGIRTVEAVVSGVPEGDAWVNAFFANYPTEKWKTITLSVNNRGLGNKREYFFDYKSHGWKTDDKPELLTLAAIFDANGRLLKDNSLAFCNGTPLSGTPASNSWDDSTDSSIQLGGRVGYSGSGDYKTYGYTIHAIRIYNRELTASEIRRNAKRDAIRFFGAKSDGLSIIVR